MKKILAIAIFAMLGGGLREGLNLLITWPQHFWLTCLINVTGAFFLSFVTTLLPSRLPVAEEIVTGMSVGLVGSFTTFSAFTVETLQLAQNGHSDLAFVYITVSLGLGLLASFLGNLLSEHWAPEEEF